jgi:hypothetical protein
MSPGITINTSSNCWVGEHTPTSDGTKMKRFQSSLNTVSLHVFYSFVECH